MSMTRHLALICVALLAASVPAWAQDSEFLPEDADRLEQCLEAVKSALSDRSADGNQTTPQLTDCIGAASGVCMDQPGNSTTIGMSQCMSRETAWWDDRLNAHYADLRETIDTESFAALREAQRAWMGFRDAECEFQYSYWRDGTIRSTFFSSCMLEETARRAIALEAVTGWAL